MEEESRISLSLARAERLSQNPRTRGTRTGIETVSEMRREAIGKKERKKEGNRKEGEREEDQTKDDKQVCVNECVSERESDRKSERTRR